ncbi:MAG: YukJ family protein [Verrucomicrobia bacterium]|nr:YukJ family protein [Verrucomicrobiota bacterium]
MPLKSYAVLKGRPRATRVSAEGRPHFQLHLEANGESHRVAINVRSMLEPSEMEYLIKLRFGHPITAALSRLAPGLHALECKPGGLALDYIRLNLFPRNQFMKLPSHQFDGGTDLNQVLEGIFAGAISDPGCWVYVYGEPWEADAFDRVFRFQPSRGLHDVHMNQGNDPCHLEQDGCWQDGAVLIEHPRQQRWTGLFLKFQSQSWHTDPGSGHALAPTEGAFSLAQMSGCNGARLPESTVRIIAALVHPLDSKAPHGSVSLLNVSPYPVDLGGWHLAGDAKGKWPLRGRLAPGEAREIPLGPPMTLGRQGGIVTLVNHEGLKVHGVYYTAEQAARAGWRIPF